MSTLTATRHLFFSSDFADSTNFADNYSLAFFRESATAPVSLSNDLLAEEGFVFLFLNAKSTDIVENTFRQRITSFLNHPIYQKVKFLWIENPLDSINDWRTNTLSVEAVSNGDYRVSKLTYFDLRNYAFGISKGCTIQLDAQKNFIIDKNGNDKGLEWSTAYGAHRMYTIDNQVILPMIGAETGCLKFDLNVIKKGEEHNFGYPQLTQLDIGFRIFTRDSNVPELGNTFYYDAHRYPLFDESCTNDKAYSFYPEQLHFGVTIDPVNLLDANRSFFKIKPPSSSGVTDFVPTNTIPSGYRTNVGRTIHLYPTTISNSPEQTVGSKLIFSKRIIDLRESDNAPLYLVPSGDFRIAVPDYKNTATFPKRKENIVCGISGIEYIQLPKNKEGYFSFFPNKPGFAKTFTSTVALLRDLPFLVRQYAEPNGELDELAKIIGYQTKQAYLTGKNLTKDDFFNKIREDYFSTTYRFTPIQDVSYEAVETVEALIDWIWQTIFDNADLDISIDVDEDGNGLNISVMELLRHIRLDYFPPKFQFTTSQIAEYQELGTLGSLENLIVWFWEKLIAASAENIDGGKNPLSPVPSTSWVYFWQKEEAPLVYYAQPDNAVLHTPADKDKNEFLNYLEIPAIGLPKADAATRSSLSFPMLPYGEVDGAVLTDIKQLEIQLISNQRRSVLQEVLLRNVEQVIKQNSDTSLKTNYEILKANVARVTSLGSTDQNQFGTTPQGLLTEVSNDYLFWENLQLALCKDSDENDRTLALKFTKIEQGSPLKTAFQSSQLFMVMTNPDAIRNYFSDHNRVVIQGWGFILDPNNWAKNGAKPGTILLFKFQERPLLELAANPKSWSFGTAYNEDVKRTSRALVKILQEAVEVMNSGDEAQKRKYAALAKAATQPSWTGILALNVHVPLNELPDELLALSAGMDKDKFYSQYIGVEMTPVEAVGGELVANESSLFGLIDYKNEGAPEADNEDGYDFHVRLLTVVFENSLIVDFAAEILLVMDRLFHEPTTLVDSPTGRNLVVLKGTAQRIGNKVTYAFGFTGANKFALPDSEAMSEVEIVRAQFFTDSVSKSTAASIETISIVGRFAFWGTIRFKYRSEFDALSFGPDPFVREDDPDKAKNEQKGLPFADLEVFMNVALEKDTSTGEATVTSRTFVFDPNDLRFDLEKAGVRTHSLYNKFPLKLTNFRFVNNDSAALKDSGFMPVKSPLKGKLGHTWYAFTYELNLGSVGSLAGKAGIIVSIMVAWSPSLDDTGNGFYIGLKLPGSVGGEKAITIQGIFKIVFKSIQFVVYDLTSTAAAAVRDEESTYKKVGYLLKIKNILMKFFVLSLPPNAQTEIILFGDPRDGIIREEQLLGWYASFAKKPAAK